MKVFVALAALACVLAQCEADKCEYSGKSVMSILDNSPSAKTDKDCQKKCKKSKTACLYWNFSDSKCQIFTVMETPMKGNAYGINGCSFTPAVAKDNSESCLTSMYLTYKEKKTSYSSKKMCASMCSISSGCVMWKYTKMDTPKDNCVLTKSSSTAGDSTKMGYYKYCKSSSS